MKIANVDWHEVGKYLAVTMSPEDIAAEGLKNVIPTRQGLRLRKITINYLKHKRNASKWNTARKPGVRQQKKMLALAVSHGVYTTLSCHTYKVGDTMYQQMAGGSIGLELTGAVARPFMLMYDDLYKKSIRTAGIELKMYERYIDDSNQVAVVPPPGSKYDPVSKKIVMGDEVIDMNENDDERLAKILIEIANNIVPGITMEYDVPSKNIDNKMPILDMKVWMEDGDIMFQHYEKPTASGNIMHAKAAQSVTCRNSVHTQDFLRRLLNSSPLLDWGSCVAPVLSQ